MIAKIAAAAPITHFAHAAGHQNIAMTITAAANKNRQKQSFMIFPPSLLSRTQDIIKYELIASPRFDLRRISGSTRRKPGTPPDLAYKNFLELVKPKVAPFSLGR